MEQRTELVVESGNEQWNVLALQEVNIAIIKPHCLCVAIRVGDCGEGKNINNKLKKFCVREQEECG